MPVSRRYFKNIVKKRLSEKVEMSFQKYVKFSKPKLWGLRKSSSLRRLAVRVALYKEIMGLSFDKVLDVLPKSIRWSKHTLVENQKALLNEMGNWADEIMDKRMIAHYQQLSKRNGLVTFQKRPLFLLDSVDFPVQCFRGLRRSNKIWSYKLNGPGRRYMLLSDGNGIPLKVWGGYSPKAYDGHWVCFSRDWFNKHLKPTTIIADSHFWSAQDELKNVNLCPIMPLTVKPINGIVRIGRLKFNVNDSTFKNKQKEMKSMRSAVERQFAQIKNNFVSLQKKFRGEKFDLDNLIKFSAAVLLYNSQIYY